MNSQPRNVLRLGALAAAAVTFAFAQAQAFDFGPPDGYCGNPPDGYACNICHYEFDLNSGDGSLQLIGLPATAVAGTTYTLTVRISDPEQQRWGFELTAVDDVYPDQQGGQLVLTDPIAQQLSEDGYGTADFLKQTKVGSHEGEASGPIEWSFDWKAPATAGASITFYLAGNAANADDNYTGDYIYTLSQSTQVESPTPTQGSSWGRVKGLYRR